MGKRTKTHQVHLYRSAVRVEGEAAEFTAHQDQILVGWKRKITGSHGHVVVLVKH